MNVKQNSAVQMRGANKVKMRNKRGEDWISKRRGTAAGEIYGCWVCWRQDYLVLWPSNYRGEISKLLHNMDLCLFLQLLPRPLLSLHCYDFMLAVWRERARMCTWGYFYNHCLHWPSVKPPFFWRRPDCLFVWWTLGPLYETLIHNNDKLEKWYR